MGRVGGVCKTLAASVVKELKWKGRGKRRKRHLVFPECMKKQFCFVVYCARSDIGRRRRLHTANQSVSISIPGCFYRSTFFFTINVT